MTAVKLTWCTPNAEEMIVHMARVSAPKNQGNIKTIFCGQFPTIADAMGGDEPWEI
jgi:hypothetical protein